MSRGVVESECIHDGGASAIGDVKRDEELATIVEQRLRDVCKRDGDMARLAIEMARAACTMRLHALSEQRHLCHDDNSDATRYGAVWRVCVASPRNYHTGTKCEYIEELALVCADTSSTTTANTCRVAGEPYCYFAGPRVGACVAANVFALTFNRIQALVARCQADTNGGAFASPTALRRDCVDQLRSAVDDEMSRFELDEGDAIDRLALCRIDFERARDELKSCEDDVDSLEQRRQRLERRLESAVAASNDVYGEVQSYEQTRRWSRRVSDAALSDTNATTAMFVGESPPPQRTVKRARRG